MAFDESKTFSVTKGFVDLEALAKDTVYFLENRKKIEKAQYLQTGNGYLIQAKDPIFSVKGLLGLNKAIQFQLILNEGSLTVKFSTGEWIKHMVGAGVGVIVKDLVFYPLVIPSLIGMASQLKIVSDVYKFIEKYVTNPSAVIDFLKNSASDTEDKGFIFRVKDVFSITGQGTVVTGEVDAGSVSVNDEVYHVKQSGEMKTRYISGIELYQKNVQMAIKGDNVGLCLLATPDYEVEYGDIICTLDAIETSKRFKVGIYTLPKNQGGKHMPLFEGGKYQYDMALGVDGNIYTLGEDTIIWPGEGVFAIIELSEPCAAYKGMEFNILENGSVRARCVVAEILGEIADLTTSQSDGRRANSFYADVKVFDEAGLEDPIIGEATYSFNFGSHVIEGTMQFPADRDSILLHGTEDVVIVKLSNLAIICKGIEFKILEGDIQKATGVISDFTDKK